MNPQSMADDYIADEIVESMESSNYTFDDSVREYFREAKLIEREHLGTALLIGSTFFRLCILNCSKSVKLAYTTSTYDPIIRKNKFI